MWGGGGDGGGPKNVFPGDVMAQLNLEGLELKVKQRQRLRAFQPQGPAKSWGDPKRT